MRFEFEWQESPGVRDKVLAATWARLSLHAGGLCATEAIDERSESRRTSIHGSVFPLTEWLVEHWWHLLHEPSPRSPFPSGRNALSHLRPWLQRHNLLAARDGGALPDLTLLRDGSDVVLQWEADPISSRPTRIRFIGRGRVRVKVAEFEHAVASFVEAVLARLAEKLTDNDDVRRVAEAWYAIRAADSGEAAMCQSLATMGVDPYDPDEASAELVEVVERCLHLLPAELRSDLFEDAAPRTLASNLAWVEQGRHGLRHDLRGAHFPTISLGTASTPHEIGYETARRVRTELLSLPLEAPLPDLTATLIGLGWGSGGPRLAPANVHLDGLIGLDGATAAPVLVTADRRNENAERFRLARAAFFPVSKNLGTEARLLTSAATPLQRASRAFAAELLVPKAALERRVSGRLTEQEVENLAIEFRVNPQVILHQIENHDLGFVDG